MKHNDRAFDPDLEARLLVLSEVPPRSAQAAARGRAHFLAEAEVLARPITASQERRHNGWFGPIQLFPDRKERSPMFATLISLLVAATMLVGGGATVVAAQDSLPGQGLYPIKLASEDLRLNLTQREEARVNLHLEIATRRAEELGSLLGEGTLPSEALVEGLQAQLNTSLELAAGLEGTRLEQALVRARAELNHQAQVLQQAGQYASPEAEAVRLQVQEMVQERIRLVESGIEDPQNFRFQLHNRSRLNPEEPGRNGQVPQPLQNTPEPGSGFGPGPFATGTCTPGSSSGPGPAAGSAGDPGQGYGPGPRASATPQPESGYGPGPAPEDSPEPGSGYGPGPGPDPQDSPEPEGGYGPGATQPPEPSPEPDGSGGPGPQGTCTPEPALDGSGGPGPGTGPDSCDACTPQGEPGSGAGDGAQAPGDGGSPGGGGGSGRP